MLYMYKQVGECWKVGYPHMWLTYTMNPGRPAAPWVQYKDGIIFRGFLTLTLGQSQARQADNACIEGAATWPSPTSSTINNKQHAKKLTIDWHAIHGAATWHTKELSNGKHAVRNSHTPRSHALYRQGCWKAYLGGTSGGRASV